MNILSFILNAIIGVVFGMFIVIVVLVFARDVRDAIKDWIGGDEDEMHG